MAPIFLEAFLAEGLRSGSRRRGTVTNARVDHRTRLKRRSDERTLEKGLNVWKRYVFEYV